MTTLIPSLVLLWSIFGIYRFNHDYKRPIVISGWLDLFLRYGPVMCLICVALYLTHNLIKWRSEDPSEKAAPVRVPSRQTMFSLRRADDRSYKY